MKVKEPLISRNFVDGYINVLQACIREVGFSPHLIDDLSAEFRQHLLD